MKKLTQFNNKEKLFNNYLICFFHYIINALKLKLNK